jgi:alpha-tubulin suppressor-like RCC1 family protein
VDGALSQINFATSSNNHAPQIGSRSTTNVLGTPVKGEIYFVTRDIDEGFTQKMVIKPDGGFVGIGTGNPIGPLHVSNVSENTINLTRESDVIGIAGGASCKIQGGALAGVSASMGAALGFALVDTDGAGVIGNTHGYLYFETKDSGGSLTEKMRITDDGKVGIGTNNPSHTLSVSGSMQIENGDSSPLLQFTDTSVGSRWFGLVDGTSRFAAYGTDGVTEQFVITNGGKVGIGTDDPLTALHIKGAGGGLSIDNNGSRWTQVDFLNNGTAKTFIGHDETNKKFIIGAQGAYTNFSGIGFSPDGNSVEKMIIKLNGNVGIGTTTPGAKLSVVGLTEHVDNTAALAAGLVDGDLYRTADYLKITHYTIPQLLMVSAGRDHSLFLTTAGDVYACGYNNNGQLGDGTINNKFFPTYITGDVAGISAGGWHSMFLSTGNDAYACGLNSAGRLGDGTTDERRSPTRITGDVAGISAGTSHSMFLSTSSESYACGFNQYGALGDGTADSKYVPTHITGDVAGISAGYRNSMFLSTSNEAYACGLNGDGQLGDGSTVNKDVPTHITGDVAGISAGGWHLMFLSTSSESYACGLNTYGRLGDGTTVDKHVPTRITGDVAGISANNYHSMFLSTSSKSYACGDNTYGTLGDGTLVDKLFPTYITGDVAGISAGQYRSTFLSTSSESYACGLNSLFQLGDGTQVNKYVPTYITGQGA